MFRRVESDLKDRTEVTVEAVSRACRLIEAFRFEGEQLSLTELVARSGLSKTTTFRILRTLEVRGWIERISNRKYRSTVVPVRRNSIRLGYASLSEEFAFSRTVTESLVRAAESRGIALIALNNRYSAKAALRNAETLIREKVAVALEFQADEQVAPAIASQFANANIPLIAIEIPHPGAVFYGANNYVAGQIGGRYLGRWARQNWNRQVEEVILLELPMAGKLPHMRLTGMLAEIRHMLPNLDDHAIRCLNGNGRFAQSLEIVRKHLRFSRARHTLVCAINDPSAIGAVRAFEEAGRGDQCVVMGQSASVEARAELRRPGTRLIGSVGYFPELYGEALISLSLNIANRRMVPPTTFVRHQLITAENIDHYYPCDAPLNASEIDSLLLRTAH